MTQDDDLQARYVPVSQLPTIPLQQTAIAIIFLMTALSVLIWGTRMYYRFRKKQIGLDDWLVTITTLFAVGLVIPNYYFFRYGYTGFPTSDVPQDVDMEPLLFYNWIIQVLYNPILALVESSILFSLGLSGHRCSIRWSIYALNILNMALMIEIFLTVTFQTIPIRAYWDLSVKPRHQTNGPEFYISTAIITIVTDFLVLAIPFWVFVGLKMRLAAKMGLLQWCFSRVESKCSIAIRSEVLVISRVTIVGILRVIELHKKFYKPGYDSKESLVDTLNSAEVNLAIIACCGPALWPLFRKVFPRLFSGRTTNEAAKYNASNLYGNGTTVGGSFHLRDIRRTKTQTEIRGYTPNGSEEEIMTHNGILRTTAVDIEYDDVSSTNRDTQEDSRRE